MCKIILLFLVSSLTLAPSVAVPAATMFNALLRPLKEAVGANAAAEPTRREAIVSFIVDGISMSTFACVR
jgi:hypothetical protein